MAAPTFVFSKIPQENTTVIADLSSLLKAGETITNLVVGKVTPLPGAPTVPLTATIISNLADPQCQMTLQGGVDGLTYGFDLTVTTTARVLLAKVAIAVAAQPFVPYTTQNPDALPDLLDTVEAGKAALGLALFQFPPQIDPSGGYITWELMSIDGTVYAAGNAYEVKVNSNGVSNTVIGRSVITVPSTVPPTLQDQKYQLRYTLQLPLPVGTPVDPSALPDQNTFFYFEGLTVTGLNTVPLGTQPVVELRGTTGVASIVVDHLYDKVSVTLYRQNTQLSEPAELGKGERTANGWFYAATFPTDSLDESIVPYTLVWKYWRSTSPLQVFQETANFWVINPSIASAISDVKAKINKARTTLYGTPDLLFPQDVVLVWLRRGMDYFNGAFGKFTDYTMTNALGPIREYWLMCSEYYALISQELAEAEKAFDFQGAAISLNVDRTQAYGGIADKIKGQLDNELKDLKVNLITKGNIGGDGSQDPTQTQRGAMGSVGITMTQASPWSIYPYWGLR